MKELLRFHYIKAAYISLILLFACSVLAFVFQDDIRSLFMNLSCGLLTGFIFFC